MEPFTTGSFPAVQFNTSEKPFVAFGIVPYPVVGGMLAGTGWLLTTGGFALVPLPSIAELEETLPSTGSGRVILYGCFLRTRTLSAIGSHLHAQIVQLLGGR